MANGKHSSGLDSKEYPVEFITVHYTAGMTKGSDGEATAIFFKGAEASAHFCTGNDGVFYCTDESLSAWHAGDSSSISQVGEFKWIDTGLEVMVGDPLYPVFTISNDFYYEINGRKTSVEMAKPWNYSGRNTDHVLNSDGTISSKPGYTSPFTNRLPETFINDLGLPFKVENGKYYIGTTWWCYTQVYEGRICSTGGNRNSIGIESCVNEGSNLWYTWQITAQLVAHLMQENDLDINRVVGHHFYTAKDCPQPMLENDMEIWYELRDLIEAEYEKLTEFEDYKFELSTNSSDHLSMYGYAKYNRRKEITNVCVDYTVTVTNPDGTTEEITLYSMVPLVNLIK